MSDPIRSISQNNFILADQKEVAHDNTLSGNGTPESPLGLNETVLWSNANGSLEADGFTVSEQFTNFERIRYIGSTNTCNFAVEIPTYSDIASNFRFGVTCMCPDNDGAPLQLYGKSFTSNNGLTYTASRSLVRWFDYGNQTSVNGTQPFWGTVYKIIGINRIANN